MSQLQLDHRKGLLITGIGGLVLSADIPLLRLGQGETWSTLLLRSVTTFISALIIWAVWVLQPADCAQSSRAASGSSWPGSTALRPLPS